SPPFVARCRPPSPTLFPYTTLFRSDGKFDRSLLDTGGEALVISQFTLIADTAKGNRPSFSGAARPERAEPLYERFCTALRELGRSEEHTSELQSLRHLVCRLLLEKK